MLHGQQLLDVVAQLGLFLQVVLRLLKVMWRLLKVVLRQLKVVLRLLKVVWLRFPLLGPGPPICRPGDG